jgi:tetratricopeptide (TPR) repeat protein
MIQNAVSLDPQNGAYLDSLGWVYFKMGQYALSEANLHKAIDRMSNDPTVHDHMGELYAKTGRLKLAAQQWEQSLREYARSEHADAEPGDVSKVQKKLESARIRLAKGEVTAAQSK